MGGLLVVGSCWTCTAEPFTEERDLSVMVDTVGTIPRVTISGEAEMWELEDSLRLGGLGTPDADLGSEFAWVSSVSWGPDRLLYVADLGNDHIAVFDTLGQRVETIGRTGSGPGEFEELFSLAWLEDHLLTMDIQLGRVGLFSPDRRWLEQRPAAGRLAASPVNFRLYQVAPGEVYQWAYELRDGLTHPTWRRHSLDGPGAEWSRAAGPIEQPFPAKVVCTMGRGFSWFDHPFAVRGLEHPLSGNRSVTARTDSYRIAVLDQSRDTLLLIARDVPRPALTDEAWNEVFDRYSGWLEDKDPSACEPRSLHRPESKPALESLMVDVGGRIWVERNLRRGTLWEVFTPEGELLAAVPGFDHDRQRTVPWLSVDRIAWVRRGDLDVPSVHAARLSRPGAG